MSSISHVSNVVNESVIKNSFSSSVNALAQTTLLTAATKQEIPNISFTEDGKSESLESIVNTAIGQNEDANLLTSLSQVNSYAATDALLEASFGTSIDKSI